MKRRLNILCVIVVLVLSYSIFETAYYFVVGVKAGLEAGIESDTSAENQRELINMKYISLLPEHLSARTVFSRILSIMRRAESMCLFLSIQWWSA